MNKLSSCRHWILCTILVAALALYVPSVIRNAFVTFDDALLITNNPFVHGLTWTNIRYVFTHFDPELYVPVTLLSYQIEYTIGGLTPQVFHATSLLLHLINITLLFVIARRLSLRVFSEQYALWIAVVASAAFVVHPLFTETVVSASARKDLLSSTFALASMAAYLRFLDERRRSLILLSMFAFALGLLAKISIAPLPIMFLLIAWLDTGTIRKADLVRVLPFFVLSVLLGIVALQGKEVQLAALTFVDQLLLLIQSIGIAFAKILVPIHLSVFYPQESAISITSLPILASIVLIVILVTLATAAAPKNRVITIGIAWFLLLLLPNIGGFSKGGFLYAFSDRFVYLPGAGLLIALAALIVPPVLCLCLGSRTRSMVASIIAIAVLGIFGALALRQSAAWKDSETLYRTILLFHPHSAHALNNLGSVLFEKGELEEAKRLYELSFTLRSNVPEVATNLGKLFLQEKNESQAMQWLTRATEIRPDRPFAEEDLTPYFLLASIHDQRGRSAEMLKILEAAQERAPNVAKTHFALGVAFQRQYRPLDALPEFTRAVELDPGMIDAHYRLAAVAAEAGNLRLAEEHLQIVVGMNPAYEQAADHLQRIRLMIEPSP